jgi:hypothetical protein
MGPPRPSICLEEGRSGSGTGTSPVGTWVLLGCLHSPPFTWYIILHKYFGFARRRAWMIDGDFHQILAFQYSVVVNLSLLGVSDPWCDEKKSDLEFHLMGLS